MPKEGEGRSEEAMETSRRGGGGVRIQDTKKEAKVANPALTVEFIHNTGYKK